jgi:hypothetical protein
MRDTETVPCMASFASVLIGLSFPARGVPKKSFELRKKGRKVRCWYGYG